MNDGRPPWEQLGETFQLVARYHDQTDVLHRAKLDQIDAEIRDYYDSLGLCVADEWTAYTALVTNELLAMQTVNATRAGLIDLRSARSVHGLLIANAAMLTTAARSAPC